MKYIYLKKRDGSFIKNMQGKRVRVRVLEETASPYLVITPRDFDYVTITHRPTVALFPLFLTLTEARQLARTLARLDWKFGMEYFEKTHPAITETLNIIKRRGILARSKRREERLGLCA